MNSSASLCIKILSLAVVAWAVLSTPWLTLQNAAWVPWVVLVLLILLEAYATDSKPAAWSQWSAGLLRMQGPGMLPYYAVLAVFLSVGPGQVRQIASPGALAFPTSPSLPGKFDRSSPLPTQHTAPTSAPVRPTGFPGSSAPPRPTIFKPAPTGKPEAIPTNAPPVPAKFSRNPPKSGPAQSPAQALPTAAPPAQGLVAPTSSARPPAAPAK